MNKSKRKLSLDRETLMPLQSDTLGGVNGGVVGGPGQQSGTQSVGFACSNCVSVPPLSVPQTPGPISVGPRSVSGIICVNNK